MPVHVHVVHGYMLATMDNLNAPKSVCIIKPQTGKYVTLCGSD